MTKRDWRVWPGRIVAEVNGASGLLGVAGAVVAGSALFLSAPMVAAAGGAVALGGLGWAMMKAIPKARAHPSELVGRRIYDFLELENLAVPLRRIGFVGPTLAGKSTMVSHLQFVPPAQARTDSPYAVVIRLPGEQETYFALVDAAGHRYNQQFKVADHSDDVVVFLDHDESASDTMVSRSRLSEEKKFLDQLRDHVVSMSVRPSRIHILLNKRDLWEGGSDVKMLSAWFAREVKKWELVSDVKVTSDIHSNRISEDLTSIIRLLTSWS